MTVNMISEGFDMPNWREHDVKREVFVYESKEECPAVQTVTLHFSGKKLMYWYPTLSQVIFYYFLIAVNKRHIL